MLDWIIRFGNNMLAINAVQAAFVVMAVGYFGGWLHVECGVTARR